jgi:membrane-associated phospholipid phosphatase
VLCILFIAIATAATNFTFDPMLLRPIVFLCASGGMGVIVRRFGFSRTGGAFEAVALFIGASIAAMLASVLLVSINMPLADNFLAQLDAKLFFGFDRQVFVQSMSTWPSSWHRANVIVYHSFNLQPCLLILIAFISRNEDCAWTFVLAWIVALVIAMAIFPLVPALGSEPYAYAFESTFNGARDGSLRVRDARSLTGVMTFPSFHAAAAVMLGWSFGQIRLVAPLFVPLNIAMFGTAMTVGGHYLVDITAGGFLGILAIRIATNVQRARTQECKIHHTLVSNRGGVCARSQGR